ncbi:MAG TPA: lysylphosphatidylglycerol synthase domain-containing protein [Stellaceae bacterium]|jgi:putative membrane protein
MRLPTIIAWLAGIAALTALIAFNDPVRLADGIAALGWWLIAIVAWHAIPLIVDARAWQLLYRRRPPALSLLTAIWIGEGVNGLFPIPHLGEIARARIARHAAEPGEAAATVVVDLTLGVATELVFALLGVALLATWSHKLGAVRFLAPVGAVIAGSALAFYLLQRAGLFALAVRIAHRWSDAARRRFDVDSAAALDDAVRQIYLRRGPLTQSAIWRLAGWLVGSGETWLVFHALGQPIGIADAIIIESLGHAARSAAFVIPGGLGAQDGALLILGAALGLGPEAGLVLALTKRLREMVLGLPALATGYAMFARPVTDAARANS